jgi:hypothetical protein
MGRALRLGAYGDPAAVPYLLWIEILTALRVRSWVGYTHAWARCDARFRSLVMASVDSPEERETACGLGWRTFRVRGRNDPILAGEFVCPAANEAGKRLTCIECNACSGGDAGKASPVIIAHGCINQKGLVGLRKSA